MWFNFRWFPRRKSASRTKRAVAVVDAAQPQLPSSPSPSSPSTSAPSASKVARLTILASPSTPTPSPSPSCVDQPPQPQPQPKTQHRLPTSASQPQPPPPPPSSAPLCRPRPIPNSYWATPLLLACEYPWTPKNPDNPKLDSLLRAGIRTFIDLTECGELMPYNTDVLDQRAKLLGIDPSTIEYHRFPIRDRSLPSSKAQMEEIMVVLKDNEQRRRMSAVHCRGGIGRTGMVIGCWFVESGVARDGAEALERIAGEWKTVEKCTRYPHSPETGPQFDFVFRFQPFVAKAAKPQPTPAVATVAPPLAPAPAAVAVVEAH